MKAKFLRLTALCACVVCAMSAFGEILMYDGFPIGDGGYSTTDATALKSATQPAEQFTTDKIFGFNSKNWQGTTGVINSYTSGLSLPDSFAELPAAAYVGSGSAGAKASGTDNERGQYKTLSSDVVTAIKANASTHLRFLMYADAKALSALTVDSTDGKVPDKSAYSAGICLTTSAAYGSVRNSNGNTTRSAGFAIRRVASGSYKVSLLLMGTEDSFSSDCIRTYDLMDYTAGTTIVCYLRIDRDTGDSGKEQVYAMVQDAAEWDSVAEPAGPYEAQLVDTAGTGAPNLLNFAAGSYKTQDGYFKVDEFALSSAASDIVQLGVAGAPSLSARGLTRNEDGSYTARATIGLVDAVRTGVVVDDGTAEHVFEGGGVAVDEVAKVTFATDTLAENTTYRVRFFADSDTASITNDVDTLYTGALSLVKECEANEYKLVPGQVTVSRADASPYSLKVCPQFTTDDEAAVAGVTYGEPAVVYIPAGETSAVIELAPKMDPSVTHDVEGTMTLASGNYEPVAEGVSLTILDLVIPSEYNVWIAGEDGSAADAANWSYGHVPQAAEAVLFDGDIANTACSWDSAVEGGPSAEIAGLKVEESYTATITVATTFDAEIFGALKVTGDATIEGGKITHLANNTVASGSAAVYRLNLEVGGDFTLGANAKIDALGKGYAAGRFGPGGAVGAHAATTSGNYAHIRGDVKAPEEIGAGGNSAASSRGGGAVKLTVVGAATINGTIDAESSHQSETGGNPEKGVGAGGSVYITAASIGGTGTIIASAYEGNGTSYSNNPGSGGRVALVATSGEVTLTRTNVRVSGSAGWSACGGGTIFVKNATDANGELQLHDVKAYSQYNYSSHPPLPAHVPAVKPGEKWVFDRIIFRGAGMLAIPEGAELEITGGFAALGTQTASSTPAGGIVYLGGTITVPEASEHVLQNSWLFQAVKPYTFPAGDVVCKNYAGFGAFTFNTSEAFPSNYPNCTVSVPGALTVESGAYLFYGNGRGPRTTNASPYGGHHGGTGTGCASMACDSILDPVFPGASAGTGDGGNRNNAGGAAFKLNVGGLLTMNGTANVVSTENVWACAKAASGSLNITAAAIAGSGVLKADGLKSGSNAVFSGGGGRIAIRLTGTDADFGDFTLANITADGAIQGTAAASMSSAGTIYLQSGSEAEGAGTVIVRSALSDVTAPTPIPSLKHGGENDVLKAAKLSIESYGRVQLAADLRMASAAIGANAKLDLNGKLLTVGAATVAGVRLAPGVYTVDSEQVSGKVLDTAGGGTLRVVESGLTIIVR
ncbi:MAG: hypothetical protein ACI4R9_06745 [Kiritimatiellia bacterium]